MAGIGAATPHRRPWRKALAVPSLWRIGAGRLVDHGTVRRAAQRPRALPGAWCVVGAQEGRGGFFFSYLRVQLAG